MNERKSTRKYRYRSTADAIRSDERSATVLISKILACGTRAKNGERRNGPRSIIYSAVSGVRARGKAFIYVIAGLHPKTHIKRVNFGETNADTRTKSGNNLT